MRTISAALIAMALTAAGPVAASAEASSSNTANVGPTTSGQVVGQGSAGFDGKGIQAHASSLTEQPSQGPPSAGVSGADITFKPIPFNALPFFGPPQIGIGGSIIVPRGVPVSACPPGQTGFYEIGPDQTVLGIVCVGAGGQPGAAAAMPLQLAERASAEQPWPRLQVGVNPLVGLTGLASSFWLAGSPQMPDATASAGPITVSVHATLVDVSWSFGDGGRLDSGTDLGHPFPAPSGIEHVYQTDTFGHPGGYVVSALLRYDVTYSVNGGPPIELGAKAKPYSATYAVNQLQPEAVSVP